MLDEKEDLDKKDKKHKQEYEQYIWAKENIQPYLDELLELRTNPNILNGIYMVMSLSLLREYT